MIAPGIRAMSGAATSNSTSWDGRDGKFPRMNKVNLFNRVSPNYVGGIMH